MADTSNHNESKGIPPYVSFRTFENFLDTLHARVIPSRIDKAVMATMSGGVQSHLMSALRYLEFVTTASEPTERMKAVVNSEGEERKKRLLEMTRYAYPFLFKNFDLANVTPQHLEEQFQANTSATGATLKKCVVFFLAASKAAGCELSPLLKKTRVTRGNSQRRRTPAGTAGGATEHRRDTPHDENPSNRFELLLSKFPTLDPSWTDEIKAKWFESFERLLEVKKNG